MDRQNDGDAALNLSAPATERAGVALIALGGHDLSTAREEETRGLVRALGLENAFLERMRVRRANPATLLASGQVALLAGRVESLDLDLLVVDADLTPVQQRNLEQRLATKILDRTGMIVEIFGLRARSAEGRLQVEMARLVYERSRLVRTWTHLERQRGGLGFVAGPGESQLESDRRLLDKRIDRYRARLERVRRNRRLQGARRTDRNMPAIALIGYTNAGKSTLFNAISGAGVPVADMPFATLDPTAREITLPSGRRCALIDTVGFIADLPTCLIAAFRATIEQAMSADLLLHLRDLSHPASEAQDADVRAVLRQLAAEAGQDLPPTIVAGNKIDAAGGAVPADGIVPISAKHGTGLDSLLELIDATLHPTRHRIRVVVPPEAGRLRAWLYQTTEVLREECEDDGSVIVRVLATPDEYSRIRARSRQARTRAELEPG